MKHLGTATLRRALREPHSLLGSERRHLSDCGACRERSASAVDSRVVRRPAAMWAVFGGFVLLLSLVLVTPLRSAAAQFFAMFEPRQFVVLPISRADAERMRALPDLSNYGTMRELAPQRRAVAADARAAARLARMPVRVPAFVPGGVGSPDYRVASRTVTAFTFSAVKAAAAAAAGGFALPAMPAGLDGSTLTATVGPLVTAAYRTSYEQTDERRGRRHRGWPKLLIAQMPMPIVASNGVSAATVLRYLAAQPGIPPHIAAGLNAISDPTSTLPIPIPIDRVRAERVVVRGAPGMVVGDNTGVGAAVIWQSDGFVYGVAGTLPAQTIVTVANSLH